jgi:hypothetical protein
VSDKDDEGGGKGGAGCGEYFFWDRFGCWGSSARNNSKCADEYNRTYDRHTQCHEIAVVQADLQLPMTAAS